MGKTLATCDIIMSVGVIVW